MSKPKFSVVIPTYNRAEFITRTIESVLEQTNEDFEIIVVDDGSADNTGEVVRSIADKRVSYHYKKNEERAVARNTGRSLARGSYITFLDSDDLLYPDHLAVAGEVIEKFSDPEFFHLGYEFVDPATGGSRGIARMPEIANDMLVRGNALSCNGVFLRKDVAELHPFNPDRDLSGTEDYELWLRLASRYPLYCDSRVTSAIIQHDQRSVVTTDQKRLVKRIELLEKYLFADDAFVKKFERGLPEFRANNRIYIALHLALAGQQFAAVRYLATSLACSPKALKNRAFYGTIKRLFVRL